jgi:AraC-like DNA-binding protein
MVRTQSLRGYPELVGDLGGNAGRLLRRSGIDPVDLNQLTAFIGFQNLIDLLERSAHDLECPDFGLRLAERQDVGILGTLGVAMRYSATVGQAIQCASKYIDVYNAAIAFRPTTGERRGEAWLVFTSLVKLAPHWAQTAEHGIGLASRIMTMLSEGRCHLRQVRLPHAAVAPERSYYSRFAGPLHFRAGTLALVYSSRDLDLPISGNNRELHELATSYLARQLPGEQTSFTAQVRQAIEALLGTGTCGYREVAGALYMHPRTLQRRLRDEGTTFEAIKDETRRELATRYLSHPDVPLNQVSALLDYSEESAFGRSCRRWFRSTPHDVRARTLSHRSAVKSASSIS